MSLFDQSKVALTPGGEVVSNPWKGHFREAQYDAFMEASRPLAEMLGQVRRQGSSFYVGSRTRPGREYRVDLAIDNTPVCECEAFAFGRDCWHSKLIREELKMSESTALVPVSISVPQSTLPSERELSLIDKAAAMAYEGAVALPKELNTKEKVAAVMLYGWELGLKPMTAIRHIYIVNGRPQPSAEVMAGALMASEPDAVLSVTELTDQTCTMRIRRPSRNIEASYTCTWAEYEKTGLARSDVALKYPRDRLRWHTTKRILRIYAPDAINGLESVPHPIPEAEYRELDATDLYNEGDVQDVQAPPRPTNPPPAPPQPRPDDDRIDPDAILFDPPGEKATEGQQKAIRANAKLLAWTDAQLEANVRERQNTEFADLTEFEAVSVIDWLCSLLEAKGKRGVKAD